MNTKVDPTGSEDKIPREQHPSKPLFSANPGPMWIKPERVCLT
jgi:hypothetical protein